MKNTNKKVLTVQDISCVGQCSLTVALPVISACGIECAILPSAVLSTHTAGFEGFTFRDLSNDFPSIIEHWKKENISFDAVYTGYLGSVYQIEMIKEMFNLLTENGLKIIDPAMGDKGKLYPLFDEEYAKAMAGLAAESDYTLPNVTEAAYMTGTEYKPVYDEDYIKKLVEALLEAGTKNVILTDVSYNDKETGVVVANKDNYSYYRHEKIGEGYHGTGDIFSSVFVGKLIAGCTPESAAQTAADFICKCIKNTVGDKEHWYGVKFEPLLGSLSE